MLENEKIREKVRFLKWSKGIDYKTIAADVGINEYTFYNFISGTKANLGYKKLWMLNNYLESLIGDEEWKK